MDAAIALYASGAVLLVIAGAAKAIRPATAANLIDALGAPTLGPITGERLALVLGVVEVALGISALVLDVPLIAVAVGGLYTVFALTVLRAMAVGAESCGCFGRVDAPPSWFHVVGNSALAVCAFVAAAGRSPLEVMDDQPAAGIGFVVVIGVLAGLEFILFTALPEAVHARRRTRTSS